mgnify:CR=1 FL=1
MTTHNKTTNEYNHYTVEVTNAIQELGKRPFKDTFIFDIETDGFDATKIHCIGLSTPLGERAIYFGKYLKMGLEHLANAKHLIGHNIIGFDLPVIKKLYPDWSTKAKISDTLVMARVGYPDIVKHDWSNVKKNDMPKKLYGRQSLEAWGYRLGIHKGDLGSDGNETDWTKDYDDALGDYCLQDVSVNLVLYEHLLKKGVSEECLKLEQDFMREIQNMMDAGFHFDVSKGAELYAKLSKRKSEIEVELQNIFPPQISYMKTPQYYLDIHDNKYRIKGDCPKEFRSTLRRGPLKEKKVLFNPSSRDQIGKAFIEKYNWKPKEYTNEGKPKVDESVLTSLPFEEAKPLAEYMMLTKRVGQLAEGEQAWLKLEKEGRIHSFVNHNGAVSGRCTHSRPNLGQVPAVRAPYGKECRELFNVPTGYSLVGADMSGLELRCLAHYLHTWDEGEYAKEILSGDIHTMNQWAAGLNTRDEAKRFIYAFLYGAGSAKIGEIVGGGIREGMLMKNKFLNSLPALESLMTAVEYKVKNTGELKGLDGRPLPIRSVHSALNLLLQSCGAVLMKKSTVLLMEEIYKANIDARLVAHVHDEVQLEVVSEMADHVGNLAVECMKKAGKDFKFKCPLDGEYKVGKNWSETH